MSSPPTPIQRTNSPATIRAATIADLPTLMTLLQLKAEFDGCPDALVATPEQLERDWFGENRLASVLLADVDGHLVGFATYHAIYSTFLAKPGLWLDDLYLKAEFRNQGIGKALIQRLCEVAFATGCGRVDWTVDVENSGGIRFYERMGAVLQHQVKLCRLNEAAIAQLASS